MKKNIILILKGFVMGVANIIPGVSGGTLALTLGIYEDFISSISNFFKDIKKNIFFLLPIFIGIGLAIVSMSHVISLSFEHIPFITTLFFMGLVVGGIPLIFNKVKGKKDCKQPLSYVLFLLAFALVLILAFSNQIFGEGLGDATFSLSILSLIKLFVVGVIAAATMIIPGVSGSLVLMLLGYYQPTINAIKELTEFKNLGTNFVCCMFLGIGVIVGIVFVAKLIEWLFKKHETKTYFAVLGFIISSIIAIPVSVINEYGSMSINAVSVIGGIIAFVIAFIIGYKLGEK